MISLALKANRYYRSLLEAAGEILLFMNLITYNGKALTATITATFQTKRTETTNDRSAEAHVFRGVHRTRRVETRTEILR